MNKEPTVLHMFCFANDSARQLKVTFALVSREEIRVPEIENNATAPSHACCQSPEQIAVQRRVEVTKALRHHNRKIVSTSIRLIVANIRLNVARAAAQKARLRNGSSVTFNTGYRVTAT